MSHVVSIETKVKDLQALVQAVLRLGGQLVVGQKEFKWYGRYIGDSAVPQGMTPSDYGKCDHAIRFPGAKYEIGVVKEGDLFQLRYDEYQPGGLSAVVGPKAGRLIQAYAIEKAKRVARMSGKRVIGEQRLADGTIKLRLSA
jgi:hypothetical protein